MIITKWNDEIHNKGISYLTHYAETSMFLLQNIEEHGTKKGEHHNSGNYYVILDENEDIQGVFVLANRGNILFQIEESISVERIINFLGENEATQIIGVLGENNRALEIWNLLKNKSSNLVESFSSCEILYSNNISLEDYPEVDNTMVFPRESFDTYMSFTKVFYTDQNLPDGLSEEQHRERFNFKVENNHIWCLKNKDEIVSMSALNAKYKNIAQVGGVFTPHTHRSKGYSKICMNKLLHDCIVKLGVDKVILFTASDNYPAQKVYEKIGFKRIGHYGMYFGRIK